MTADLQALVRHIRRMASRDIDATATDRMLLERYVREHDETAFATVVGRHAALVAGVCGRVLGNTSDVEDVFQATFLLLARKTKTMQWRDSVANWLYGVAHRLALRARSDACRRQALHTHGAMVERAQDRSAQLRAMQELLDEEMERLPEAERKVLVHCYLEGHTRDEAAQLCKWSLRTLDRHLNKGRDLLRLRLARRGLELSGVMMAVAVGEQANAAGLLTAKAIQFVRVHASPGGAPFSASSGNAALSLANTGLPIAGISYLKVAAAMFLIGGAAALGTSAYTGYGSPFQAEAARERVQDSVQKEAPRPQLPGRDRFGDLLPGGALVRLGTERFRSPMILKLAFSPDNWLIYSADQNGVQIMDASTGEVIRKLGQELPWPRWSSAYSADGKLMAISYHPQNEPQGAAVYEAASGRKISSLQIVPHRGTDVGCFSPDGKLIGVSGSARGVDVYEAATGAHVDSFDWDANLPGTMVLPCHVAFTPDSKSVIGGSAYSGIVRTRDLATGRESQKFTASPNGIYSMISSPDGARLAIVARRPPVRGDLDSEMYSDDHVHLFDVVTGREIADMEVPDIDQYRLIFSPDGKVLFAGRDEKGSFLTWDAATGKALGGRSFEWASSPININLALALSSDGKLAAVGDWSCVRLFDRVTGQAVSPPAGHTSGVHAIALAADDFQAATNSLNGGKIILWNRATGEMLRELDSSSKRFRSHLYSHDGRTLYSYSIGVPAPTPPEGNELVQNGLQAWNTTTGKVIWNQAVIPSQYGTLALSPDGRVLAVGGKNHVALFEGATGKPVRTLVAEGELGLLGQAGPNTSLLFTPDGAELLAWGISNGIHRWEVATGNHVTLATDQVQPGATGASVASFSPDAKRLVLGAWADHLLIVDAATGKEVNRIKGVSNDHAGGASAIAFSPDGRMLAWGGPVDGKVRLVDPATGATIRELAADSGRAISLHFSADGKTLAAGYANSSALIWDLREAPGQK